MSMSLVDVESSGVCLVDVESLVVGVVGCVVCIVVCSNCLCWHNEFFESLHIVVGLLGFWNLYIFVYVSFI